MVLDGDRDAVAHIDLITQTLALGAGHISPTRRPGGSHPNAEEGIFRAGPADAGNFVEMIHIGIGHGLTQTYAENFDTLRNKSSPALAEEERFKLNQPDFAEFCQRGSVNSLGLLDLSVQAVAGDPRLD